MKHKVYSLFFIAGILFCKCVNAQIPLPLNTVVTETFTSLGTSATATLPTGWKMTTLNVAGTWPAGVTGTAYAASSGAPTLAGRYNFGTTPGTDRALGFIIDGSYNTPSAVMAYYKNNTGAAISTVTVSFSIERYVVNSATFSLSFSSSINGTVWTTQAAGDIDQSYFPTSGVPIGTFDAPKTISRTVTVNVNVPINGDVYFRWEFNTSNTAPQGLGLDDVSVYAGTATPVIIATLQDILQVDNNSNNQFNEGDVIRYKTVVQNTGTGNASAVQVTLPTPPVNTIMVAGSIKTSAVAVDDNYNASFNTLLSGSSVLVNDMGIPLPTAIQTFGPVSNPITNAGNAGTTNAGGVLTVNVNGTFTYTPPTGFSGIDQFKYITGNGNLPNNDALVSITVGTDITFATTNVDPLCNGGSNGSITFNASGGNGPLTYSITGAGGTYFASNVFTGLAAGTYNIAVKDAGGYIKTGSVTLNNPAVIVVSGNIPGLIYTVVMATANFTKTGGAGTITWSATGLPPGVSINSSTGDVTGTPTGVGAYSATITATDANGCSGSKIVAFNVQPKLTGDIYGSVVGNTQLVADGHSTPATPFTASATNILANDASNAAMTVTAGTFSTTNAGTITVNAAGKFIYTPKNGSTTADSYTYTVTSNGITASAVINFTITNMIWYVNNTVAGGNGSSNTAYQDVAAAEAASLANQYIYVHTGVGNTTGAALLKSGQTLRGAGNALTVGALTIAAGTKPTLTGMITLANTVTVDGFDMNTGTTTAITSSGASVVTVNIGNVTTSGAVNAVNLGTTTGTVTITGGLQTGSTGPTFNISGGTVSVTYSGAITQAANAAMVSVTGGHNTGTILFNTGILNATNGTGLQFDNADGIYTFSGTTTLNGGDAGIDILNGSAGTFNFANLGGSTAIINPTGVAININASSANVTYSGSFSKTNNAINGIFVNGETGGTITINGSGTKTLNTSTANAINLTGNTGAVINFSGNNILLTTTSGTGFNATGGGTISVLGTGNIITSTTGTALNVANTTIAAGGITFQSISANGAVNGIVLNATGSGALTVSGTGSAGSGGTIQNCTNYGISLTNTQNPSFTRMIIQNISRNGIDGTAVVNFAFTNSTISNTGTAAAGQYEECGMAFNDKVIPFDSNPLSGIVTITGNTITQPHRNGIDIETWSGTISNLNISGNTLSGGTTTSTILHAILVLAQGSATTNATITTATISNNAISGFRFFDAIANYYIGGSGIFISGGNTSNTNFQSLGTLAAPIIINGNAISNIGSNFILYSFNGRSGEGYVNITNNGTLAIPMSNAEGLAVSVFFGAGADAAHPFTGSALVDNNVADMNPTNIVSNGIGIQTDNGGAVTDIPTTSFIVTNNTVKRVAGSGIIAVAINNAGSMKLRIQNNDVPNAPLLANRYGIRVSQNNATASSICLNISGNKSIGSGVATGIGLRRASPLVFGVNGMAATSTPAVEAYINGINPLGGSTQLISATTGFSNCSF